MSMAWGVVPMCRNFLRKSSTPKLFIAEPKNMGVCSSLSTLSLSSGLMIPSNSSTSSISFRYSLSPIAFSRSGSSKAMVGRLVALPVRSPRSNKCTVRSERSRTPWNSAPSPMGHTTGKHVSPNSFSIWSMSSRGSRLGRSSLLQKVKMGSLERRQTSRSLRVCGSSPLAASMRHTALSQAAKVRYVSSLKSWCPGVSSKFILLPW
mmetsp:Transcript_5583/g.10557  ORF Transcript_5583/g.10557 Transcript_5583/m.10557 type:complete len:206 (-) Transcript_5583:504-1121(-)